jgi:hypothetical protein
LAWCVFIAGGSLSGESANDRWNDWVDDNNACVTADDCVVVHLGCPLGCFAAVSEDEEQQALVEAQSLLDAYSRYGRGCGYGCPDNLPPTCDDGVCMVVADESF